MNNFKLHRFALPIVLAEIFLFISFAIAQNPPYDVVPTAEPPYYRVRYEASTEPGELIFPVSYTVWIPDSLKQVRGVIVHQHGCGEGSCKSGLTGAFDLHWQALASKHGCALLAAAYEQPQNANCQMWCDPRNGSADSFQQSLVDLGKQSGHPELASVPWALWGHSGGGHWSGGMALLYPDRVAAAWLRSGVPLFNTNPDRPTIKPHSISDAVLGVPIMCNPGTKEGVTVKDGRFAGVWPAVESFFDTLRGKGGLVGIAVDPLTAHECGNQRYLAIHWLDACLNARLPAKNGEAMRAMPTQTAWLATVLETHAVPAKQYDGDPTTKIWLPNESVAKAWMQYVTDTAVVDLTPPPPPTSVQVMGNRLTWQAKADFESGLARFVIYRDGQMLSEVNSPVENRFGRPIFQGLQYSDTPAQPLVKMEFEFAANAKAESTKHHYQVRAVNTVGLESELSAVATVVAETAGDRN